LLHLVGYLRLCTKVMQGHTNIKFTNQFPFGKYSVLSVTDVTATLAVHALSDRCPATSFIS